MSLRVALAQVDVTVGDIAGNERIVAERTAEARAAGAGLVVFPELVLTGYPAEDLWLRDGFLRDARSALDRLAHHTQGIVAIVGFPELADVVYNSIAVLAGGEVRGIYRKVRLPNYGVFDENRYFRSGESAALLELGEHRVGLTICEDMWEPGPPASDEALAGAALLVNPSASPYHAGKGLEREEMLSRRALDYLSIVLFVNHVGGQDELVFDGDSLVVGHDGEILARAAQFQEELLIADVDPVAASSSRTHEPARPPASGTPLLTVPTLARTEIEGEVDAPALGGTFAVRLGPEQEVYAALCLGVRDYVEKNGFAHVVLGLSGGVDSALVACVAVDALGAQRVSAAIMPSPHSSPETQADARTIAANLGLQALEIEIAGAMHAYEAALKRPFAGRDQDLTEENIQARIRGTLLMALSNKFGWLVLTTGNKSEMSVGYSTLYGDSAGGFAVLKDVPKTLVYKLIRHRNAAGDAAGPIPASVIDRAPSAELRPGQRDEDSLPPYDVLDPILEGYVEQDLGREQLVSAGFDAATVAQVLALVDRAEYKRRQNPPGIKITPRAFGRDRRMPITNRYSG